MFTNYLSDNDPRSMPQMAGVPGMHDQPSPYDRSSAGQVPWLMDLLRIEYGKFLRESIYRRRAQGQATISLEEALEKAPFQSFFNFCVRYLAAHRPVQSFPADANIGFMLSNNVRAVLCPHVPNAYVGPGGQMQGQEQGAYGPMQSSGAVPIAHGLSQPGLDGALNDGGIPII